MQHLSDVRGVCKYARFTAPPDRLHRGVSETLKLGSTPPRNAPGANDRKWRQADVQLSRFEWPLRAQSRRPTRSGRIAPIAAGRGTSA
jgi:hypothetical protein